MAKLVSRLFLIVVVFVGIYAGFSYVIAASVDRDGRNLARWFLLEARRTEALNQRAEEMAQAEQLKRAITEEVIAERLSLPEAAEQFRAADALVEADHDGLIAPYRVPETDAGWRRQVINWVRLVLQDQGHLREGKTLLARLEKETGAPALSADVLN